jgi:hypothetical protein
MSYRYGNVDLATPEGIQGFDRYYAGVRHAINCYQRDTGILNRDPSANVTSVHDQFLRIDRRAEDIIGDDFPRTDPEGAEAFMLHFVRQREFGSNYTRDLLGAIAIDNLLSSEPRYPARVCRAAAGLALGNPQIIRMPGSRTMTTFMIATSGETPDPSLDINNLSMLIEAYNDGAFPIRSAGPTVPAMVGQEQL